MNQNKKILLYSTFRNFLIVYTLYVLARWITLSTLPLYITQKFNSSNTLIISLSLKILPAVICAPLIANILPRIGFKKLATISLLFLGIIQMGVLYVGNPIIFQSFILLTGILDTIILAALLALRTSVIPAEKNISANTLFTMVDSVAKIVGPLLSIIMLWKLSFSKSFYILSAFLVVASIILLFINLPFRKKSVTQKSILDYSSFLQLFLKKPVLWSIYIPILGYALLAGSRNLFLFWYNKKVFLNTEVKWNLLLTAHGCGAILGSIIGIKIIHWLTKKITLLHTFLYLGLLRGVGFLLLSWITNFKSALILLVAVGIPETLEAICFFTLLQKYLTNSEEENIFYTFNTSTYYAFFIAGTLMGRLYTMDIITLQNLWILITSLTIISILPFVIKNKNFELPQPITTKS